MAEYINVKGQPFFGRVEEQKRFRAALQEVLSPYNRSETSAYIFLLFGDGGMGKTTLSRRYMDIVQSEFKEFQTLWLDWEAEKQRSVRLQVDREQITAEDMLDTLYKVFVKQGWKKPFEPYAEMVKKRQEVEQKVAEMTLLIEERPELAALRGASATAIAKLVRLGIPIGETGESLVRSAADAGLKSGAEALARVRQSAGNWLKAKLDPDRLQLFLDPQEQLAVALGMGLKELAEDKPLVLHLDTYEIVDRADQWLRVVIQEGGPNVIWVIGGRDNLVKSRQFGDEFFRGYEEEFAERLISYDMRQLALQDIQAYFQAIVPDRPLAEGEDKQISQATRGIPLAVRIAAELWKNGQSLSDIVKDQAGLPGTEVVQRMTERYLLHCLKTPEDKRLLFALALAQGRMELLQAMLLPEFGLEWEINNTLAELGRNYACVLTDKGRLHQDAETYFLEYLKAPTWRQEVWLMRYLSRVINKLEANLATQNSQISLLAERYEDENWLEAVTLLTDYLFWLAEDEAWQWLMCRFVESWGYNPTVQNSLLATAHKWQGYFSPEGQKRIERLVATNFEENTVEQVDELFRELAKAQNKGWLAGEGEAERWFIIQLKQSRWLWVQGQHQKAEESLLELEEKWPSADKKLLEVWCQEAFERATKLIWVNEDKTIYSPQAEWWLSKVLLYEPDAEVVYLQLGETLSVSLQPERAIAAYQTALKLNPKKSLFHHRLAHVYQSLSDSEMAIEEFSKAISIDSEETSHYYCLVILYRQLKRYDKALASCNRAIEINHKDGPSYHNLAHIFAETGNNDLAIQEFLRAITLDPANTSHYHCLAKLYCDLKKYTEAVAAYQQMIILNPQSAIAYLNIGSVYRYLEQNEEAITAYQQAIALDPQEAAAYNNLGNVYREVKRHEEAITAYQQAITLNPQEAVAYNNLGNVYREVKRHEEAITAYQQAIDLNPQYADAYHHLAHVYEDMGKNDVAIQEFLIAINLNPKNLKNYFCLANIYYNLEQYEEAITAFQQAITIDPQNANIYNNFGTMYHKLERYEEAITAYQQAITLNPQEAAAYYNLGNVYREVKRNEEAITAYQQAITLNPQDATAYNNLGYVYHKVKRVEEAITTYQQAITINPQDDRAYGQLGLIYRIQREHLKALDALKTRIELAPKNVYAHMGLADVWYCLGEQEKYIEALAKAKEFADGLSLYDQACLAAVSRNTKEALRLLALSLEENSDTDWVRQDPDFYSLHDDPRFWELVGGKPDEEENKEG